VRMRLPSSIRPADAKKTRDMGGFRLKRRMKPASVETESRVILSLLNEIRVKTAINIDAAPSFERKIPAPLDVRVARNDKIYLVVGGEHGNLMAEAMRRKGNVVDVVVIPGLKASAVGVSIMEDRMKEAMIRRKPDVIVIDWMDDNCYYGLLEDGSTKAATSGEDGVVHYEGRLVVGKKDSQDMLYRRMEPIWEATKGTKTIIVIPRVRFVVKACCEEAGHVSNCLAFCLAHSLYCHATSLVLFFIIANVVFYSRISPRSCFFFVVFVLV
jgi:hypothetical protein